MTIRTAIVSNAPASTISRYMPDNYKAYQNGTDVIVVGEDNMGWTLDGYVIPRLASGMFRAVEILPTPSCGKDSCNNMDCPDHGVSASNRRQSEFYAKYPRG